MSASALPPPSSDDAHANAYADTVPAGLPAVEPVLPVTPRAERPDPHAARPVARRPVEPERQVLDLPAAAAARARQVHAAPPPAAPADADGFDDSSFGDSHFVESQFLDAADLHQGGDESGSSRRCPMCSSRVKRILRTANDKRRWDADDWRRYRCRSEDCDWQGLMQASGRSRRRRNTPAQPTVTTARPRWALTLLAMLLAAALSWGAMQALAAMTGL